MDYITLKNKNKNPNSCISILKRTAPSRISFPVSQIASTICLFTLKHASNIDENIKKTSFTPAHCPQMQALKQIALIY